MINLTRRRKILTVALIATVLVVIAAACGGDATATPSPTTPNPTGTADPTPNPTSTPTPPPPVDTSEPTPSSNPASLESGEVGSVAPEITGIVGWLNSEPLTLEELRGQVVLVDFWTYTCVNCIRTFPFLKDWHDKYSDRGLVIVGVHTPEFQFEKSRDNVAQAIERHGLGWPVAQDNDFGTWRAFNNRFWPAKYLLDKDSVIRYRHFGEGAYDETEEQIRDLLKEIGSDISDIEIGTNPGPSADPQAYADTSTGQTRELYAGWRRNRAGNPPYIANTLYYSTPTGVLAEYEDTGEYFNHFLVLSGSWIKEEESIVHGRETENLEDYIALKIFGTSTNVVINLEEDEPFEVVVTLNDEPLQESQWGADIMVNGEGLTYIEVNEPRMYNLVQLTSYEGHDLKLSSNSDKFSVFAFTFGSYNTGP